jgi:hypothetical protein
MHMHQLMSLAHVRRLFPKGKLLSVLTQTSSVKRFLLTRQVRLISLNANISSLYVLFTRPQSSAWSEETAWQLLLL